MSPDDPHASAPFAATGMAPGSDAPAMMSGFGNSFETEAIAGALPQGQNSPQRAPYGLYAEQLSGSPFTAPRTTNERSWLYRIRPSVRHIARFERIDLPLWASAPQRADHGLPLAPYRWGPVPVPAADQVALTFVSGLRTITTAGDVASHTGMAVHLYLANTAMEDEVFSTADGELLIVPQQGRLELFTELGRMRAGPGEIAVVPRGMAFQVTPLDGTARGYVCETYGARFTLPERGPIGANCLANPRDFRTPVAAYQDHERPTRVTLKWCGQFHQCTIGHSPLDVVAWHGNYVPYTYDLRLFSPVGAILYDHPDPSIFTVLTSPTAEQGTANVDFVWFGDRWLVAEHSFRPPWYHRNIMSEFMGLIYGRYDAKEEGFLPGGFSLHNCMLPHGPDQDAFVKASRGDLAPHKLADTLAFMFETRLPQQVTAWAAALDTRQDGYADCWRGLERHFDPQRRAWSGP